MKDPFHKFRNFSTLEQAVELKNLLKNNNIEVRLTDNVPSIDATIMGSTLQNHIEVKIKLSDFKKAETILESQVEDLLDQINEDYYLFEFTNDELYEVLLKSDEWNEFDYSLAQKLLIKRGETIDKNVLESLKDQRLKELAQPDGNQKNWIILGYILSILGGFLGCLIGYFLWTSRKTLPNGEIVFSHTKGDRKHGKYIFYIGVVIAPLGLFIKFLELLP